MKKILLISALTYLGLSACSDQMHTSPAMSVNMLPVGLILPLPDDGAALIAKSDCIGCHKIDKKLIGPAYIDIANKYEINDKNIELLANRILKGSKGIWGPLPMSAHPTVSQEDATTMVKYILSLKKTKTQDTNAN